MSKLNDIAYITKLAGFEHTKYIQGNCTHQKQNNDDKPLFIGKTVRNGAIDENFDWYIKSKISEELPRSQLNKKCIVLPYVGSVGDLAIFNAQYKAHLGSNIAKIELNEDCQFSEEFIYYYLKSPYGQKVLLKDIQGAIQKNITMDAIRNVEIPDIDEITQNKIVNVLLKLDNKINTNNKIIAELEAMAKTIYDYWFLQYEFPNEGGKPYKSSGGKIVWNEELKKQIPEGWESKKIVEIEDNIVTGKTPSTKDEENFNGNIPFITIDDIRQGLYVSNTVRTLSEKGANLQIKKYIPKDSICVTCIATVGLVGITTKDSQTNQQINSIVCKNKNNLYYLVNAIKDYFEYSCGAKSGNIFDNMNKEDFASIKLIYPTEDVLEKFIEKVEPIYSKIKSCILENEELTKLRDYLLPLLMNGQVGFKN